MTLGERLRSLRKDKGFSLRSAATEADISVAYMSRLENDDANPTVDILQRLASTYQVRLSEIADETEKIESTVLLPKVLREFIEDYSETYPVLNDQDWQRMLGGIRLRGKYPATKDEWLLIFLELRRTLE